MSLETTKPARELALLAQFSVDLRGGTLCVMSHLLISYLTSGAMNVDDPKNLIYLMPALLMLCIVAGFILLKIPTMTASLFSGHTGGHGIGMGGLITATVLKGF